MKKLPPVRLLTGIIDTSGMIILTPVCDKNRSGKRSRVQMPTPDYSAKRPLIALALELLGGERGARAGTRGTTTAPPLYYR